MQLDKSIVPRVWMVCAGIFFMSFFISLFIYSSFGTDPCTCMNLGVSGKLGLSLGVWQLISNSLILIVTFLLARKLIGIGTLVNMVFVGFLIDFFRAIFARILPANPSLTARVLIMAVAVAGLSFSAALYMYPQLGVSPYDSVPIILTQRTGIDFRWCRMAWDLAAVLTGWLCGSVIGVGTVITAFFLGPLIKWFTSLITRKFPLPLEKVI